MERPDDDRKNLALRNVEHGVPGPGWGLSASRCCRGSLLEVTMVPGALPRLGEPCLPEGAAGEEGRRAFR